MVMFVMTASDTGHVMEPIMEIQISNCEWQVKLLLKFNRSFNLLSSLRFYLIGSLIMLNNIFIHNLALFNVFKQFCLNTFLGTGNLPTPLITEHK